MFKRWALIGTTVACLLFGAMGQPSIASAQESRGICKLYLTSGPPVEGEVTEYPDKYEVKELDPKTGKPRAITRTIPKTQVKKLEKAAASPAPSGATAGSPNQRPTITEAMIAEILGSEDISAQSLDIEDKVAVDVMAALEPDEESVRDMLRIAGVNAKVHYTDHFVFIYTSDPVLAAKMASNLERIYRWVVTFNEKNGVKSTRPKHKLEIFFFGTFEEYDAFQTTNGFRAGGAIGFYMPNKNRSAFFDMMTYPPTKADLAAADATRDGTEKRRIQNRVARRVKHYNDTVVQHEAGHHIHFNLGVFPRKGDVPTWMVEGLATMFETIEGEAGASYGAINHQRLFEFRQIYGQEGERLPDMRLFILFNGMWQGFPSYSLGWALNQYLARAPKHKEKYKDWMKLLAARDDDENVPLAELQRQFEIYFGEINEDWVKEFVAFMRAIQLKMAEVRDEGP